MFKGFRLQVKGFVCSVRKIELSNIIPYTPIVNVQFADQDLQGK